MDLELDDSTDTVTVTESRLSMQEVSAEFAVDDSSATSEVDTFENQLNTLKTWIDSVPYGCESPEQMLTKLELIVQKLMLCAQSKEWMVLTQWDALLTGWLLMRYPIPKSTRAKLVRFYYELCLLPGIGPSYIRKWADMLARLLIDQTVPKRMLEESDLQLPWRPLWCAIRRDIWPKSRLQPSSFREPALLLVANLCNRYFTASEIPEMLQTLYPLVTEASILNIFPVLTTILPPTHPNMYLPSLFALWEAFNSSVIDERLLDMAGYLSVKHVSGQFGTAGEGGAKWKDVGIWSEKEWTLLVGKGLAAMGVPVGAFKGSATTSSHADSIFGKANGKKSKVDKPLAFARILVYSMAVDGPIRTEKTSRNGRQQPDGFLAGSKALDTMDRVITSMESFYHPSNSGAWSINLTSFISHLAAQFCKRWKEEELPTCRTPLERRLTPPIRRAFVKTLRTPALIAMFSKDSEAASEAHNSLRFQANLEPSLVVPEVLERAYGGLEAVIETHRTTAVLMALSVIAHPLVSEKVWLGGQKHVVPLLEMSVPGIDLNDPTKTLRAATFIVSVIQHMKISDLSIQQSNLSQSSDAAQEMATTVGSDYQLPVGTEMGCASVLSKDEERALTRDSTAGFADWLASLFRRVLSLYENLPEEGGRKHRTGGKTEESVLKVVRSMLDVVCLHLSDPLFDMVLNLVGDYAMTNGKSNAVRAIGQLVACLSRAKPEQTIKKLLPHCIVQIKEELKHGASSNRTTGFHAAVPSDTTLHWNISILHGCLGYGGPALIPYKHQILELLILLVDKTKSERGYTLTGRLIIRILHTLTAYYPVNRRFVNLEEWEDPAFNRDHNTEWGKLYKPEDVTYQWHVPSSDEIMFVMDILDQIHGPALDKIEALLETTLTWDGAARNDFCRFLSVTSLIWAGLPTFLKEEDKDVVNPCLSDIESADLQDFRLSINAGFTLSDPQDPGYQKVVAARTRFGNLVHRAASALRQNIGGDVHVDAILGVATAIDVYLLEFGVSLSGLQRLQKNSLQAKNLNITWPRQQENSRLFFLKRAQLYDSSRVYMQSFLRRRSALDDKLFLELVELSLSPYVRVRRSAQSILRSACECYVRATKFILPSVYEALRKGNDPDRMKGALYILSDKFFAGHALADQGLQARHLTSLLQCQHEAKPSIQLLVGRAAKECLDYLVEGVTLTHAYTCSIAGVQQAIHDLSTEFSSLTMDGSILEECAKRSAMRISRQRLNHERTISSICEIATRPDAHWRYIEMALSFLYSILRRDLPVSPAVAKFLMDHTTSPQSTIRFYAQNAIVRILMHIKLRTYSKSVEELWQNDWQSPLGRRKPVGDASKFSTSLHTHVGNDESPYFVDEIPTGFLTWTDTIKCYVPVQEGESQMSWEPTALPVLSVISSTLTSENYFQKLTLLWTQETNKVNSGAVEFRNENASFIKTLAKMFEHQILDLLLKEIHPLLIDADRFKQRTGAELLAGLLRGSKHWPKQWSEKLWSWTTERLDQIFAQIKPDTQGFWESLFSLTKRDPRRHQRLAEWILGLPLDFNADSAFLVTKTLSLLGILIASLGRRFRPFADKYVDVFFSNADTGYAEIRAQLSSNLYMILRYAWDPSYASTPLFLSACRESEDPLRIREAKYLDLVASMLQKMPQWRQERLPPPRVVQSQYDKTGLTLLMWSWFVFHSPQASLGFPYVIAMMPETLKMLELNDHSELQLYSQAVTHVLSAVTPPPEYVRIILEKFVLAIKSSISWRIRTQALPTLVVFFYRNLLSVSSETVSEVMDVVLDCLGDENLEVRKMASKSLSSIVRCSQRQMIDSLKDRFITLIRKTALPPRREPTYANSLRLLHSAILGLCALIDSFPYSVEPWMPPLTEVLALHATDPPPIAETIRKCASDFKKTHQDTWHTDQHRFNEDQLQSLSTMLVGTSYYA